MQKPNLYFVLIYSTSLTTVFNLKLVFFPLFLHKKGSLQTGQIFSGRCCFFIFKCLHVSVKFYKLPFLLEDAFYVSIFYRLHS